MAKKKAPPKKHPRGVLLKKKKELTYEDTLHLQEVKMQVSAGVDLCVHSLSNLLSKLTDLKLKVEDRAARGLLISDIKASNETLASNIAGIEGWVKTLEE